MAIGWIDDLRSTLMEVPKSAKITLFAGIVILLVFLVFASAPYFIAPYSETERFAVYLEPPSAKHWFGTDLIGRDTLSRIIFGTRFSLGVASIAVALALTIGSISGTASGYIGGLPDATLSSFMDSIYSFPVLILALLFSVVFGGGIVNTGFAVGIAMLPVYFRVTRSITLSLKESTFIEAEVSMGASGAYIVLFHILPHCASSIVVLTVLTTGEALLTIAGLGFLGLGVPPPTPEWGTDVGASRQLITTGHWWPWFFPGIAIVLAALSLNLIGEGLSRIWALESHG